MWWAARLGHKFVRWPQCSAPPEPLAAVRFVEPFPFCVAPGQEAAWAAVSAQFVFLRYHSPAKRRDVPHHACLHVAAA